MAVGLLGLQVFWFLSCVCLVYAQGCAEPTDENIRSAIDRSITIQTSTATVVFLMNARIVCLASSGARDRYNFASVVATYTTDTSADPVTAQFEFSCNPPSWRAADAGVLGVEPGLNMKFLSADDTVLTAELRTDCSTCISLTNPSAVRYPNLTPDNVTHCVGTVMTFFLCIPHFALYTVAIHVHTHTFVDIYGSPATVSGF